MPTYFIVKSSRNQVADTFLALTRQSNLFAASGLLLSSTWFSISSTSHWIEGRLNTTVTHHRLPRHKRNDKKLIIQHAHFSRQLCNAVQHFLNCTSNPPWPFNAQFQYFERRPIEKIPTNITAKKFLECVTTCANQLTYFNWDSHGRGSARDQSIVNVLI